MHNILPICAVLFISLSASADVTVVSEASSTGYHGMGASKSKSTRMISGLKSREEGGMQFTGAILGRLAGGGDHAQIVRIDLDKRWDLDVAKKTYREAAIVLPSRKESAAADKKSTPEREEKKPTHRVKSVKVDVKKTGENRAINGFPSTRYQATLAVEIEEIATKKTSEFKMLNDLWTTPWTKSLREAMDEEARFQKAYLKKLGIDLTPHDRGRFGLESARMMMGASGPEVEEALGKMSRELGKIEGYTILTETSWHAPQPPSSGKKAPVHEEEEGSALSDAAGASSLGGAALGFMGGMAKRAAKKKVAAAVTAKPGAAAFSIRTEVKKIEMKAVAADRFEIPAGYKKI
jgi:hypothetical protein